MAFASCKQIKNAQYKIRSRSCICQMRVIAAPHLKEFVVENLEPFSGPLSLMVTKEGDAQFFDAPVRSATRAANHVAARGEPIADRHDTPGMQGIKRSIYRAVWTIRPWDGCRLSPRASPFHRENLPSRPPSTQLSVSIFRSDAA
jgi:hypothetical protein